jgi:hypothetical protein
MKAKISSPILLVTVIFFVLMTALHAICAYLDPTIVIAGYTIPIIPLEASVAAIITTITASVILFR